jgi:hypothetical protein
MGVSRAPPSPSTILTSSTSSDEVRLVSAEVAPDDACDEIVFMSTMLRSALYGLAQIRFSRLTCAAKPFELEVTCVGLRKRLRLSWGNHC